MKRLVIGAAALAVAGVVIVVAMRGGRDADPPVADAQPGRMVRDGIALGLTGLRREWTASVDAAARERAISRAAKQGTADSVSWLAELIASEGTYPARAAAALGTIASAEAAGQLL